MQDLSPTMLVERKRTDHVGEQAGAETAAKGWLSITYLHGESTSGPDLTTTEIIRNASTNFPSMG